MASIKYISLRSLAKALLALHIYSLYTSCSYQRDVHSKQWRCLWYIPFTLPLTTTTHPPTHLSTDAQSDTCLPSFSLHRNSSSILASHRNLLALFLSSSSVPTARSPLVSSYSLSTMHLHRTPRLSAVFFFLIFCTHCLPKVLP